MSEPKSFRLPDVGEGLTEAEVVSWRVQPGDTVAVNDIVVEIETAKSLVELPSPFAGVVAELLVPAGTTVAVGTPLITVLPAGVLAAGSAPSHEPRGAAPDATEVTSARADEPVEPGLIGGPAPGGRTSVLVGYGPRTTSAVRRPRKANIDSLAEGPVKPQRHGGFEVGRIVAQRLAEEAEAPAPVPHRRPHVPVTARVSTGVAAGADGAVLAKPPVRKLAKDLGVDLRSLTPTGPAGTLTRDDVLEASGPASAAGLVSAAGPGSARETRAAVKGVRKVTADAMVASAFTAPHVTEFVTVDVTRTMRLVERLRTEPDLAGAKVSPLLLVARALLLAVRRHPGVNASFDATAGEIVTKHYVNLGIAAATPRGLVVPNIKDAQTLSLPELAQALTSLTATAREGRSQPADLSGGTITITNVGVFGIDTGTPILPPGEAVILALGAVSLRPWVHKKKVVPRHVTTLALSFDHRLVDGDLGSRFLADIAAVLERPERALLWG